MNPPPRISLTGRAGARVADGFVEATGMGRLGRLALAYLVLGRDRPTARDELAEALWGDDLPRTWETSLRVVISKLRAWLDEAGIGRDALESGFGTYQLLLPPGTEIDVEVANQRLSDAQTALAAGDTARARDAAAEAASGTAAEFLPGSAGRWAEQRQEDLRAVRIAALELLADACTAMGDMVQGLAAAEEAVSIEPLRESAHLRVVRAHAAAGNRGEALRAYERVRLKLAEELGVAPSPQTEDAYLALLADPGADPATAAGRQPAPAGPPVPGPGPHVSPRPLPLALSSFVGREREVAEVEGLLAGHRLVTLVGTGGLGKTRLALEVARRWAPPEGAAAVLVPLAEAADAAAVGALAAAALGLEGTDLGPEGPTPAALAALVGEIELLVVLDNCEHVIGPSSRLAATLLERCPGVRVLATTREALRVAGERAWPVPGLSAGDAARLFRVRASSAHPTFAPGLGPAGEEEALAEVCRRLDGLALAIELAAARTDVLTVSQIAARLDDRFALLTRGERNAPARQQTLQGALDWSFDALARPEQDLFARLSVFAGAFTFEAAEKVTGDEDMAGLLGSLVSRSLVTAERSPSGLRYRMLETVRGYAAAKLGPGPERDRLEGRLLAWAVERAEHAEVHLDGPGQAEWLAELESDSANFRAALASALGPGRPSSGPQATGALRLATALGRYWEVRGHLDEGRELLRAALGAAGEAPAELAARAQNAAANLALRQGDYAAARSRLEAALALRSQSDDGLGWAVAVHGLASVAALQRDLAAAGDLFAQSLAAGRELGHNTLVAASLANLGWVAHSAADLAAARAWYGQALDARRAMGDAHGTAHVLAQLGDLAYQEGDTAAASALHRESLDLRQDLGDRAGAADSLSTLGHISLVEGNLVEARGRFAQCLALRRELGDRSGLPAALLNLADLDAAAGDLGAAQAHLAEAAAAASAARDRASLAHVLGHRGRVERRAGDLGRAAATYADAARAAPPAGPVGAEWLEGVGAALAAAGRATTGARLLAAASAARASWGAPVQPHEHATYEVELESVRSVLGDDAFSAAWAEGLGLGFTEAVAEALAALGT
ncbi:MAG: BTAD domain-containing putative transcriptional regulator [Actinomycetota bacterium]